MRESQGKTSERTTVNDRSRSRLEKIAILAGVLGVDVLLNKPEIDETSNKKTVRISKSERHITELLGVSTIDNYMRSLRDRTELSFEFAA